jgi:hypothetical protein
MNQLTQSDIKLLLTRWGTWSRDGGTVVVGSATVIRGSSMNLGYKSMWDVIHGMAGCGGSSREVDTEMLAIDNAMLWLKEHSKFDYRLLELKYRYNYSFNRIADKLTKELPQYRKTRKKMCPKYAKTLVELAENTLQKYLETVI